MANLNSAKLIDNDKILLTEFILSGELNKIPFMTSPSPFGKEVDETLNATTELGAT